MQLSAVNWMSLLPGGLLALPTERLPVEQMVLLISVVFVLCQLFFLFAISSRCYGLFNEVFTR